jgi:HD-GYP domain-containing protein (c-di-GMP phosphodiesterase class II)
MTNSPIVWREAMRHTSLLAAMPDDLLAQLAGRATERQFVRGEYVCHDGEYSNSLYLIVRGEVDVIKGLRAGEVVLARLRPGEPFGEMGLIDDSPRSASVRVASDRLQVLELSRGDVVNLLQTHPGVLFEMVKLLNVRLRQTDIEHAQIMQAKMDELADTNQRLQKSYDDTLIALSQALDLRDQSSGGHLQRVTAYSLLIADQLELPAEGKESLRLGALLHDIGKIGVSDAILHKNGKLTDEEWGLMRKHPAWGRTIIEGVDFLRRALGVIEAHHEWWDGRGYPYGLCGSTIPLEARIFAVADVFDALTVERPYKNAWTPEAARDQILKESGTHFDPQVVEAFNTVYKQLVDVMRRAEALETQATLPGRAPRMLETGQRGDESQLE